MFWYICGMTWAISVCVILRDLASRINNPLYIHHSHLPSVLFYTMVMIPFVHATENFNEIFETDIGLKKHSDFEIDDKSSKYSIIHSSRTKWSCTGSWPNKRCCTTLEIQAKWKEIYCLLELHIPSTGAENKKLFISSQWIVLLSSLISTIDVDCDPNYWRLLTDSSKSNLKIILLHNGSELAFIPIGYSINMTESYDNTKFLLNKI